MHACQEKNRQAQARFRERQKAKQTETERRMAELEKAVLRLQVGGTLLLLFSSALGLDPSLNPLRQPKPLLTHGVPLAATLLQAVGAEKAHQHSASGRARATVNSLETATA